MKKLSTEIARAITNPLFYITVGLFAGEMSLSSIGIQVDLSSSVMYVLAAITLIVVIARRKIILNRCNRIIFVLYLYIIVRNFFASEYVWLNYELPTMITLVLLFFLNSNTTKEKNIEDFINYAFIITGLLVLFGLAYNAFFRSTGRLYFIGGPNGFYKLALIFGCISFNKLLKSKKQIYLAFLILAIIVIIMTGSRGGIISLIIIALIAYALFMFNKGEKAITIVYKVVISAVALSIVYFAVNYAIESSPRLQTNLNRALTIFTSNQTEISSVQVRQYLFKLSYEDFLESPLIGKGALILHYETLGTLFYQPYAHNIFVEMLGEQGAIGFVLFVLTLFHTIVAFLRSPKDDSLGCLLLCFLTYLIGAQFSGNMLDAKLLFAFAILIKNLSIYRKHTA